MNEVWLNQRVFHRRADLFGHVKEIESGSAYVKYEWPYDRNAEPVRVPMSELQDAYEVEQ